MYEAWIQEYILLAFRIHRVVQRVYEIVASLQHPLHRLYALTYGYGKRLMQPWLQGPDKIAVFRRLLTEQFVPSQLEGALLPMPG